MKKMKEQLSMKESNIADVEKVGIYHITYLRRFKKYLGRIILLVVQLFSSCGIARTRPGQWYA